MDLLAVNGCNDVPGIKGGSLQIGAPDAAMALLSPDVGGENYNYRRRTQQPKKMKLF